MSPFPAKKLYSMKSVVPLLVTGSGAFDEPACALPLQAMMRAIAEVVASSVPPTSFLVFVDLRFIAFLPS
jgi:hypothetical protein